MYRHPNLPSISTLLSSPPPIIVIHEDEQDSGTRKRNYSVSPLLSPIESTTSSSPSPLPSPSMLTLPPLQGDDPPRRLSQGSICSSRRSSLWSSSSYTSTNLSSNNHSVLEKKQQDDTPLLPCSTQIILSESGQPILKRRRGRPPSIKNNSIEGGWTFLAPTVWDVKGQPENHQNDQHQNETVMNGSMAAFSSSNMDMVLQIPRKKRGRKPKTHIVGNSCFAWKDNTAPRRSAKSKRQ